MPATKPRRLFDLINEEEARHRFTSTAAQCSCGFRPTTASEVTRHQQAAIIIGVCAWASQIDELAKYDGVRGWLARVAMGAVRKALYDQTVNELADRDEREARPWTTDRVKI